MLTFALLALLATACSKDDDLTPGGNIPTGDAGQQTVTFTVGADYTLEGDARTRSEGTEEEKPTRCFLQVLDADGNPVGSIQSATSTDGTFQLSVNGLTTGTTYQFLFWADNASTTISNLKAVPYTPNTVAYAFKDTNTPEQINKKITLSHVVTKVTLQHSGANTFSPQTGDVLAVSLPCATTYNVATAMASGNSTQSVEHTFSNDASISEATPICSFYNLAPASTADITLTFINDYTLTIGNASLPANAHVTLQGDLSSSNSGWIMPNEEKRAEVFYSCLFDGNNPKGNFVADAYELFSDNRTGIWFIEHILNITRANGTYRIKIGEYSFNCQLINTTSQNSCIIITMNGYTFNIAYGTLYDHETKDFQLPSDIRTNW